VGTSTRAGIEYASVAEMFTVSTVKASRSSLRTSSALSGRAAGE
jgi:hypothetical protein